MISISKPLLGQEEIDAVVEVLKSGQLAQGPKTAELEQKFAAYCNTKYAVAFNSGTAALHAGLFAAGIESGDDVITTPFTFVGRANSSLMQNANVVFADISEDDFNLSPASVESKITSKTKAILPVDLYGQIHEYQKMSELAARHGLVILEDACQSIGAEQEGRKAGECGDMAAFSLYVTKNIMCGEGGMLTTNREDFAEACRRFRHHGQSPLLRYEYHELGFNYRMTDINAAIGIEQLRKVDQFNSKRIENASLLYIGLEGLKGLILPQVKKGNKHVYHQFTIRITDEAKVSRDQLQALLKEKGIISGVYYPKPLHLHPHFAKMGYRPGDFPMAEKLSRQVLSLPVHPALSREDIERICHEIRNALQ